MKITNVDSQPIPRIANPNKSGDRFSLSEFGTLRARNGIVRSRAYRTANFLDGVTITARLLEHVGEALHAHR
jgi:hypothetical protein